MRATKGAFWGSAGRFEGTGDPPFGSSERSHSSLGELSGNGKIYTFGGINIGGNYTTTTVDEYDPINNQWQGKAAAYPFPVAGLICAAFNGYVYCFGGYEYNGTQHAQAYKYDHVNDQFVACVNMPTGRSFGKAVTVGSLIYIIGGYSYGDSQSKSVVEVYNPVSDSWQTKAPMPFPYQDMMGGVINGKIYLWAGYTQGSTTNRVLEYDPAFDTWKELNPAPVYLFQGFGGVVNNKMYFMGGYNGVSGGANDTFEGTLQP